MYARVTRFEVSGDKLARLNTYFDDTVVPAYGKIAGFTGALSLADRQAGKWESLTFWTSLEALRSSDRVADELRQKARTDLELGTMTVDTYEVQTDQRAPSLEPQFSRKQPAQGSEASRH
jgi:hypothetical protein